MEIGPCSTENLGGDRASQHGESRGDRASQHGESRGDRVIGLSVAF